MIRPELFGTREERPKTPLTPFFLPALQDLMRDRERRRAERVRVLARDQRTRLVAREPAPAFQFVQVDGLVVILDFGERPDHQRVRERPGLRRVQAHLAY